MDGPGKHLREAFVDPLKNIVKKKDSITSASPSDFFLIPLDALRKDNPIEFDVWIEHEDQIILQSQRGSPMDVTAVDELAEKKITKLFVHRNDRKRFCGYVESHLSTIIDDDRLNEPEKARAANMAATNLAQEIVVEPDGSKISRAQRLFVVMSAHARRKSDFLPSAIRAVRTDGELGTHCANMAVYALSLASHMNMGNTATLGDFAVAGFLADIGKSYISPEILRKPGKLDGNDWRNIRRHPIHTVEHVGRHFPVGSPIIEAILNHHVRIDGTGYPNLHGRAEVSVMAQVIGVADVFDGITMDRPDRPKSAPYKALEFLTQEMRGKFDDDVIKSFIGCLGGLAAESIRQRE